MSAISNPNIILTAENLKLGYRKGTHPFLVAEHISFELEKGKLTCLLGPNGVGKSTLLKAIMGRNKPLDGNLIFEGKNLNTYSLKTLAKKIAVVLTDKITTGNLTAEQLVTLGRIPHTGWMGKLAENDKHKIQQAIKATQIGYIQNRLLSELSDGQLQKVMIARALAQDGELLILDEPTAHLDLINRFEIMQLLRKIAIQEDKAVLVVTHDLEIAIETADQFWLMQCGFPLTTGSPEDLVLDGRINLLLPNDKLIFNRLKGKVQESETFLYPNIEGPEEIIQWVKLALRKNNIHFKTSQFSVLIEEEPLTYILREKSSAIRFNNIGDLIHTLKANEKKIEVS